VWKSWLCSLGIAIVLVLSGGEAQAEMYMAGQVGYASPSDLSNVKGTGSISGVMFSDLTLKNNLTYGLKIGGYLPNSLNWLGFEFEGFYNEPDLKAQTITASSGSTRLSGTAESTKLRVAHFAVNVLARYPGETFQPYVGVGGGVNIAGLSETPNTYSDDVSAAPNLNLLAGMRAFVTERIALFGEVKHNRSTFKFSDNEVETRYRTTIFMAGLSFHFR